MEKKNQRIARTILNQIKAIDVWALGAYGAKNFVALDENKKHEGGIQFTVSGMNFKGKVIIELLWDDTYKVTFGKMSRKYEWNVVKTYEGVYCDNLVTVLDYIEKSDK